MTIVRGAQAVDGVEAAVPAERRVGPQLTHHSETSYSLPPELITEGARRLGWLGVVYSSAVLVGHFGRRLLLIGDGAIEPAVYPADLASAAAVLVGVGVYLVCRRGMIPAKRLLDLGLVFDVVGALGMAAGQFWMPMTRLPDAGFTLVSAECVWIVAFPLIVPNTPAKVLVSSLLAASMGPATLAVSAAFGVAPSATALSVLAFFFPNYVCAAAAFVVARLVHHFNVRLKHAREIGSYELIERIGEGGMGEVWRARHRLLARPAALKLIRSEGFGASQRGREATMRRFEREAQDTATLGSTHTIDIYDFGVTEEGDFYYVMELLEGLSLERFVQEFGPMEPVRVVYLLEQVCHSLGEAHARGLVHRDIKPANIFMCRLGPDFDFVKVLDFGLVKHIDMRAGQMLTVEGTTAGTPAYMAPEVALGRADVDGRADIYSLGCVAYYLLTGQPLFSRDSAVATALAHVNEPPPAPSTRSELSIPAALDSLILDCLSKDPAARPKTAFALSRRLATAVPATWTPEEAEAWWTLHQQSLVSGSAGAEQEDRDVAKAKALHRCWPRLDRKTAQRELA